MKYILTTMISICLLTLSFVVSPMYAYEATVTSDSTVKTIELHAVPLVNENAIAVDISTQNIKIQSVELLGNWIGPIAECDNGMTFTESKICFSVAKLDTLVAANDSIAKITFSVIDESRYASMLKTENSAYATAEGSREDYGIIYELNEQLVDGPATVSTAPVTAAANNSTSIILIGLGIVLVIAFIVSYISYRKHRSEKRKLITLLLVLLLAGITLISGYLVTRTSKDTLNDTSVSQSNKCETKSDCSESEFCNSQGTCKPLRAVKEVCSYDYQCKTGFCFITTLGENGICRNAEKRAEICGFNEQQCRSNDNARWCAKTDSGDVKLCYPKQYKDQVNCVAAQNHLQVIDRIAAICNTSTPNSDDNAQFIEQTGIPTSVKPSQKFTATITFKNIGESTWSEANKIRLSSINPVDNQHWGTGRVQLLATDQIATNQTKSFTAEFTAPATPGTYNFQWQMVREDVARFGAPSANVPITVTSETVGTIPRECSFSESECKASGSGGAWCSKVSRCFPNGSAASINCIESESVTAINERVNAVCGTQIVCSAMDVGSSPDGLINLTDFASFAVLMNKTCTPAPEFPALSCGSVDSNNNGKVDLVDFSKFAQLWNSTKTTKCAPVQTYNPNICWNFAAGQTNACTTWPNGCKGAKPTSGSQCTQALVDLTSNEKLQCNNWVAAGKPTIAGCTL